MFEGKLKEFEPVFYPKSIAVVGASPDENKSGSLWVKNLISAGFPGYIYPIGSSRGTCCGLDIFPNLRLVPGEVDYVVVSIPRESVLEFLDDCVAKKVKVVHFFTAGFSELSDEGRQLEEQALNKAKQGRFHIIGPNCLGVYCPESKIPLAYFCVHGKREQQIGLSGSVGFMSQSGGISDKLVQIGIARYIQYSKGVSFGNGIDLEASDFLQYLAADPKTSIIGAYIEGTRTGRHFFDTIMEVAKSKPLVVWKAGGTEVGAQVAMSHTGSLASSAAIWSAMLNQAGAIEAHNLEELSDDLLIFQQLGCWRGSNVAIIAGVAAGGGGISVSASDACMKGGLKLPLLSSKTRMELTRLLGMVGSIVRNPVDLSQASLRGPSDLFRAVEVAVEDPAIDLLLVQEDIDLMPRFYSFKQIERLNDLFIELKNKQDKPIVIVLPPGSAEPERLDIEQRLLKASIPVFPTMERAVKAIVAINNYFSFRSAKE